MTAVGRMLSASIATERAPSLIVGAVSGAAVVLGFTAFHRVFILDIWAYLGQMLFAGAVCGGCIAWAYRTAVAEHSTAAWFRFGGLHALELIALGAASLILLQPQFTMAELIADDDAFNRLLPPSVPLMVGAMVLGTLLFWWHYGRRAVAFAPILVTQVLLVFLLGHQFAFLGLVEASTDLMVVFGEFALITVALAVGFSATVVWFELAVRRLRPRALAPRRDALRDRVQR